ncbi:invasin domain 3-containing protein [Enterobacter hormaechei]
MNKIPFALGQAAQVAVLPPNAEATYANAAGGMSVFAGLVLSKRGKPRSVLSLTKETYLDVLGDAIQPHEGSAFEPIRHVAQALNGGNGYVVRVTPKNMRIPVLKLTQPASTTSSGTAVIDEQLSYFASSAPTAQADGTSRIQFMFYPKDSNGAIITGLKGLTLNPINAPANILVTAFQETNGVYTASLASSTAGTITVGLRYAADPSALAGFNQDVKYIPAIIDAGRSTITQSLTSAKVNVKADLADKVLITLFARDNTGQPVENRTDIDFDISGVSNVSRGQVLPGTTPGSYSIVISGTIAGKAKILARQNGKEITGKFVEVDFQAQQVGTFRDIDPAKSKLDYVGNKNQIIANDLDAIEFKLTARDLSDRPITGMANDLRFNVSGITFTSGGFTEVGSGEYIGSFTTRDSSSNAALVTIERSGKVISTDPKFSKSIQVVPVVGSNTVNQVNSRLPAVDIKNDNTPTVLTFYANDVNSQPISGLTDLQFIIAGGSATLANGGTPVESLLVPGAYEIEVTSQTIGVVTVVVNQKGSQVASNQMNVIEANPPVTSAIVTPDGTHTAGEDMHIAVNPMDATGVAIKGLTNLYLTVELNGAPVTPAPLLVEDVNNPGTYDAVFTSRVPGTGTFSVIQGSNAAVLGSAQFEFTAAATSIDDGQSKFTALPPTVKADGTEEIALSFEAKDTNGGALLGLAISFGVITGDDKHLTFSPAVENNGVYTGTVTSVKGGTWEIGPLEGSTNPAAVGTQKATVTFTAGIGTVASRSYMTINGLGEYDPAPDIVADGTAQTLGFYALDVDGDPITGLTAADFEFKILGQDPAAGITIAAAPTEVANGLYTTTLSADLKVDGYVEVVAVNKTTSAELAYPLVIDFTAKPVVLNDAATEFKLSKASAEIGDDKSTGITLTLTLEDTDGDPVTGKAGAIQFKTSSLVTMTAVTEDPNKHGTYKAKATSAAPLAQVAVTPMLDNQPITVKKLVTLKFTDPNAVAPTNPATPPGAQAAINDGNSSLTADKPAPKGDNADQVVLTFTAMDDQNQPITGLTGITFAPSDNTGITASTLQEDGNTGVYKQTITRDGYGDVTFTVNNGGTATGVTTTVTFVPTEADLDEAASDFAPDNATIAADGVAAAILKFEAKTVDGKPIPGLTVEFGVTNPEKDTTTIQRPAVESSPGVYTSTITGTGDDSIEFWVQVGSTILTNIPHATVAIQKAPPAPPAPQPDAQYIERLSMARLNAAPVVLAAPPVYVAAAPAAPYPAPPVTNITLSATTVGVGDDITLGNNEVIAIYVDDGDASTDRTLRLEPHPDEPDFWILTLSQVLSQTESRVLEQISFSLTPGEIDDMGLPAYLPVALENSDSRLRAVVRGNAHLPSSYQGFMDQYFIGGSDGDMSTLGPDDYQESLNVLAASMVNYTAVLALGVYDPIVLQELAKHARDVRVDMFADIRPSVSGTQAIQEAADQSLGAYSHVARYHFPYSSKDPLTGAQVVYGLSGDAFTAKAKGVSMKPDVGGWHYAPAGYTRAVLERSNIKPLAGAASVDREKFVTSRINPVTVASDGSVMIDDSLTTFGKNNYLKYQHVNSILNAIARMTYDVCQTMKHEPDGVTREGLEKEIPRLLERFVASEALVKPRDATQGEEPFVVVVKQEDFDLWNIKVFVCPTGVARRIAVEPILFR